MITNRDKCRLKLKCRKCGEMIFYNKDDIYDGVHKNEKCIRCDSCGRETTLKKNKYINIK